MSRFTMGRLLVPDLVRPLSRTLCPTATASPWTRLFSQSLAASNSWTPPQPPAQPQGSTSGASIMNRLVQNVLVQGGQRVADASSSGSLMEQLGFDEEELGEEPYHLHIYSHKHNTHVTLTKPNRDALISLSCGNIGFRKSNRKHYDSAYQLGAYVIDKMHQKGLVKKIHRLEVVLRGFGAGREAVVKVLMGNEGKLLRGKITRVSDSTRLKFGGTRSKRQRRLG